MPAADHDQIDANDLAGGGTGNDVRVAGIMSAHKLGFAHAAQSRYLVAQHRRHFKLLFCSSSMHALGEAFERIEKLHSTRGQLRGIPTGYGELDNLLGGAVIVETVFSWPGLGNLMVESIVSRDYPVIQSGVLMISIFLISLNFVVDLIFGLIDPRIRYR